MFSDNCSGQNRNRFTAFVLWYARKYFNITRIAHRFLEKGHTGKENDSIHVILGSATHRIEPYTPEQWFAAVRGVGTSKQRYRVKEMFAEDFYDFKTTFSSAKNLETIPLVKGLRKHGTVLAKRQDPFSLYDTYQIH